MYREFIEDLFINITREDIITCCCDYRKKKYDIIIKINSEVKRISIKNKSHETNYYWNDGADVGIDRKGAGREFLHLPLFRTVEHGGKCTV